MKQYLFSILALAAMTFVACENNDIDNPNGGGSDFVAPTLELSQKKVELAAEAGDVKTVTVTTDQSVINAEVSYAAKNWLGASREGNVISIKALSTNYDSKERIDSVHVIVGEKGVTAEAYIVVVQGKSNKPYVNLGSTDDIYLTNGAGVSSSVDVDTNQETLTVTVSAGDESWLKAEYAGGKITVTTLAENTDPDTRDAVVTISAGEISLSIKVFQTGTPKSIIGTAYGTEGVIFWQNPENPKEYKIISAKAEIRPWSTKEEFVGVSSSELSGPEANKLIKEASGYKSTDAAGFCVSLGEGWYLPTQAECYALFEVYNGIAYADATNANPILITDAEKAARAAFEGVMSSIPGAQALNSAAADASGDSIWVCQESTSDAAKAWYFRWGKRLCDLAKKSGTTRYARCVKLVTIE
ncbi:MAG: BACON domain-containing carbohydrate-binding protein [Candidatus Cryptobacteroides sp.]|nr:BACON domain-containing carbohydrate-binding protein [Candidatus Cryptobacteroides sp.]